MANRRLGVICAVVIGMGGTPCLADGPDPYVYTPSQPFYDWTGLYIGAHLGAANDRNRAIVDSGSGIDFFNSQGSAFVGGGQIGLQKQLGSVVIGGELSYTWLNNMAGSTSGAINTPGLALTTDVSNLFLATGKLGVAYLNMLAYAKGGFASADVEYRASGISPASTTTGRENGWTAGIGANYAISPRIILGVEYDYVRLNTSERVQSGVTLSSGGVDFQSVTARLEFKFGPPVAPAPVR